MLAEQPEILPSFSKIPPPWQPSLLDEGYRAAQRWCDRQLGRDTVLLDPNRLEIVGISAPYDLHMIYRSHLGIDPVEIESLKREFFKLRSWERDLDLGIGFSGEAVNQFCLVTLVDRLTKTTRLSSGPKAGRTLADQLIANNGLLTRFINAHQKLTTSPANGYMRSGIMADSAVYLYTQCPLGK